MKDFFKIVRKVLFNPSIFIFYLLFLFVLFISIVFYIFGKLKLVLRELVVLLETNYDIQIISLSPPSTYLTLLSVSMWFAILLLAPFILLGVFIYVKDGLYPKEKKFIRYVPVILFFTMLGSLVGAIVSWKLLIPYFVRFHDWINITNTWSVQFIIDFFINIIFSFSLMFQMPVVCYALVRSGLIEIAQLVSIRRIVYMCIIIISAFLTPPDALSLLMLALPSVILYEGTIFYLTATSPKL